MVARARDPPPPPSLTVVDTTNTTQPPLLPFVVHDSLHPLLITYVAYIPLPITLRKRPSRASPLRLVLKTACEVIGEEVRMSRKLYHVFYEDTMLLPHDGLAFESNLPVDCYLLLRCDAMSTLFFYIIHATTRQA